MNRRDFFKTAGMAAGAMAFSGPSTYRFQTKHVIWIINGNGSRKKDWYENPDLSPNYARLVKEGFVYEESHNDTVSNHGHSWAEAITGARQQSSGLLYPTPLQYLRQAFGDQASNYWFINGASGYRQWSCPRSFFSSHPGFGRETLPVLLTANRIDSFGIAEVFFDIGLMAGERKKIEEFIDATRKARLWEFNLRHQPIPREPFVGDALAMAVIPSILKEFKPRMMIFHQVGHDAGHGNGGYIRKQTGYFEYEKVCRTTDEQLGRIIDFVKNDPYFSKTTTIVVRPEFGRDDEINLYGELNHSEGYYQSCRSAEIWWGPDIKVGIDRSVKNRMDVVPSLTKLFNVDATYARGQVHAEMFKDTAMRHASPNHGNLLLN